MDGGAVTVNLARFRAIALTPATVLGTLIACSTAIRAAVSLHHTTARYMPDEYIYTELARALAHGHLQVRDHAAHFPSLLEPLLAAPLWRFFSPTTAYHLVQVENAIAASAAAIPVYLLARRLDLPRSIAYLCSLYALVVPTLVLTSLTITDFVAYPLVIASLAAGVSALSGGGRKAQSAFLIFACLASFARIQYFVLVPAYLAASILLHRRRFLREHKVVLLAALPSAAGLVVALKGFYSGIGSIPIGLSVFTWFLLQLFLLALVSGVVIVPGAVAGLLASRTKAEKAFAYLASSFGIAVIAEASVYAASSGRFKERYLFTLTPLLGVAFGVYLTRRRPLRLLVVLLAAALAAAAARLPVSAYTKDAASFDSQFLSAVSWLQGHLSDVSSSLLIASLATAGAALAVLIAFRGGGRLALVLSTVVGIAATAAAMHVDLSTIATVRTGLPPDLGWIDHSAKGPVTAIATPVSGSGGLLVQLYWNPAVNRELLLGDAIPTDSYATESVAIGNDGTLKNVQGDYLFDNSGSRALFDNASELTYWGQYRLYRPVGLPRFRLLIEGYTSDDWLLPNGRIRVWPKPGSPRGTTSTISFSVSLPASRPVPDTLRLAQRTFVIRPGQSLRIACSSNRAPLRIGYEVGYGRFDRLLRPLSFRLTEIRVADTPPRHRASTAEPTCRRVS